MHIRCHQRSSISIWTLAWNRHNRTVCIYKITGARLKEKWSKKKTPRFRVRKITTTRTFTIVTKPLSYSRLKTVWVLLKNVTNINVEENTPDGCRAIQSEPHQGRHVKRLSNFQISSVACTKRVNTIYVFLCLCYRRVPL